MNGLGGQVCALLSIPAKAQRKAWIKSSIPLMLNMKPAPPI